MRLKDSFFSFARDCSHESVFLSVYIGLVYCGIFGVVFFYLIFMRKDTFLATAGILFAFVAIVHFLRVILKMPILIGTFELPYWASIVGGLVLLCFSYLAFSFRK